MTPKFTPFTIPDHSSNSTSRELDINGTKVIFNSSRTPYSSYTFLTFSTFSKTKKLILNLEKIRSYIVNETTKNVENTICITVRDTLYHQNIDNRTITYCLKNKNKNKNKNNKNNKNKNKKKGMLTAFRNMSQANDFTFICPDGEVQANYCYLMSHSNKEGNYFENLKKFSENESVDCQFSKLVMTNLMNIIYDLEIDKTILLDSLEAAEYYNFEYAIETIKRLFVIQNNNVLNILVSKSSTLLDDAISFMSRMRKDDRQKLYKEKLFEDVSLDVKVKLLLLL